jgi:hypothetical protein
VPSWAEYLAPAGFCGGLAAALFAPDGRYLGILNVNYPGAEMPTFTLTFSRPSAHVVGQYYNFLRLGFAGYRRVHEYSREVAIALAKRIGELEPFELVTRGEQLPVFAFALREDVTRYTVFDVSRALREYGWLVPAYTFPENRTDLAVLRIVVRNGFSSATRRTNSSASNPSGGPPVCSHGPSSAGSSVTSCRLSSAPNRSPSVCRTACVARSAVSASPPIARVTNSTKSL